MSEKKRGKISRLRLAGGENDGPVLVASLEELKALRSRVAIDGGDPESAAALSAARQSHAALGAIGATEERAEFAGRADHDLLGWLVTRQAVTEHPGCDLSTLRSLEWLAPGLGIKEWPPDSMPFDELVRCAADGDWPDPISPPDFMKLAYPEKPQSKVGKAQARIFKRTLRVALDSGELGRMYCPACSGDLIIERGRTFVEPYEIWATVEVPAQYGFPFRDGVRWLQSMPALIAALPEGNLLREHLRSAVTSESGEPTKDHDSKTDLKSKRHSRGPRLSSVAKVAAMLTGDVKHLQAGDRGSLYRLMAKSHRAELGELASCTLAEYEDFRMGRAGAGICQAHNIDFRTARDVANFALALKLEPSDKTT